MNDTQWDRLNDFAATLGREEISALWKILRSRSRSLDEAAVDSGRLRVGLAVQFEGRRGRLIEGVIEKMNNRSVSVRASDGVRWRVAPTLLKVKGA